MNPKCLHCGGSITVYCLGTKTHQRWRWECDDCGVSSPCCFKNKKQALAAASKRFMPKRSVEEIEAYCEKLEAEKQKQWQLCVRDNNMSMEFMEFLRLMQFHRIADYIYGVTE